MNPDAAALRGLVDLVRRGLAHVHVERTFPFEEIVAAHEAVERGHLRGTLILIV